MPKNLLPKLFFVGALLVSFALLLWADPSRVGFEHGAPPQNGSGEHGAPAQNGSGNRPRPKRTPSAQLKQQPPLPTPEMALVIGGELLMGGTDNSRPPAALG